MGGVGWLSKVQRRSKWGKWANERNAKSKADNITLYTFATLQNGISFAQTHTEKYTQTDKHTDKHTHRERHTHIQKQLPRVQAREWQLGPYNVTHLKHIKQGRSRERERERDSEGKDDRERKREGER